MNSLSREVATKYMRMPKGDYAIFGTYEEEFQAYNDGRLPIIKTYARMPKQVQKLIYKSAKLRGWDGCHWNDPLLLSTYDPNTDSTDICNWTY